MTKHPLSHYPVWTAIITPLNEGGDIDFDSLKNICLQQEEAENGIVVLGSTGEALNLCREDKIKIVQFITSLKLKIPLLLGLGGHQLQETLEWIKFAEDYPLQGYLLLTPLYSKPGIIGQTQWFETLMNATQKPCMLYNVPGRSAIALYPEVLTNLKKHPNLWALKEASGSVEKYSQFRQAMPELSIYSGDDALLPNYTPMGCDGVVSVASNAWPKPVNLYARLALAHKFEDIYPLWEKASASLFWASNPVPVKALMHLQKNIQSPALKLPLHHSDFQLHEKISLIDQEVKAWYQKHSENGV